MAKINESLSLQSGEALKNVFIYFDLKMLLQYFKNRVIVNYFIPADLHLLLLTNSCTMLSLI